MADKVLGKPRFVPKYGLGQAGMASNYCHGANEDGSVCHRRPLKGGYYCKAHVPK